MRFWLIAIIVCLLGAVSSLYDKAKKMERRSENLEASLDNALQKVKQTEIKLNDSISLYQAQVNDLAFTQKNLKTKYDELLRASKLKPKDVGSVTEVVTRVVYRDTVIAVMDTFGGLRAFVEDDYARIDVEVAPDLTAVFDYEIRDSLVIVRVQKRHSLFFGLIKWTKAKETRVVSKNPKAVIADVQTVNVIE